MDRDMIGSWNGLYLGALGSLAENNSDNQPQVLHSKLGYWIFGDPGLHLLLLDGRSVCNQFSFSYNWAVDEAAN